MTHPLFPVPRTIPVPASIAAADLCAALRTRSDSDRRDFLELLSVELDTDAYRLLEEYMQTNTRENTAYCHACRRISRRGERDECEHCGARLKTWAEEYDEVKARVDNLIAKGRGVY